MCLILRTPPTDSLSLAEVADVFRRNSDGYGAMWRGPAGRIHTVAALPRTSAEAHIMAERAYVMARAHGATTIWHHWRMATHGSITLDNTHPFSLGPYAQLMHNGIVPRMGSRSMSDTAELASHLADVLRGLSATDTDTYLQRDDFKAWLKGTIGASRVVILGPSVDLVVDADSSGVDVGDRWYSNTYAWSAPRASSWASLRDRDDSGLWRYAADSVLDPDQWSVEHLADYGPGDVVAASHSYAVSILSDLSAEAGLDTAWLDDVSWGSTTWTRGTVDLLLEQSCEAICEYWGASILAWLPGEGLTVGDDVETLSAMCEVGQ